MTLRLDPARPRPGPKFVDRVAARLRRRPPGPAPAGPPGRPAATAAEPLEPRTLFATGGLIGKWVADDYTANAASWADTSGNPSPHNAAAFNNATSTLTTTANAFHGHQAVNFAGGDGGAGKGFFRVTNDTTLLRGTTAFTLVAVIRTAVANTTVGGQFYQKAGLIGNEQGGVTTDWGMGFAGGQAVAGVGGDRTITSAVALPFEGVVAETWDTSGKLSLYVDGALVATQQTPATTARNAGTAFALGCDLAGINGDTHVFNGQVAEFRVYNTNEQANIAAISSALRDTYIGPDVTAPTAALAAQQPAPYLGTGAVEFNVVYTDDRSVRGSSITAGDLTVTSPAGFTTVAFPTGTYNDGKTVTATYRFNAPDGGFGTDDAGNYTVTATAPDPADPNAGVVDASGNAVAAGAIGTLAVAFASPAESTPPTAAVAAVQPFGVLGKPYIYFDVNYADNVGVGKESLGKDDLTVTDSQGVGRTPILLGFEDAGQGQVRAHYALLAPKGGLTPDDATTYTVVATAFDPASGTGGVVDVSGNPVAAGMVGTFAAQIQPPPEGPDVSPPIPFLFTNLPPGYERAASYAFTVGYGDDAGVDVSSLGDDDLVVTTPYGTTAAAKFLGSTVSPDGRYVAATYSIPAQGPGGLSQADQGVYAVATAPRDRQTGTGGVADTSGNAFPSFNFNQFDLTVVPPPDSSPPTAAVPPSQSAGVFGAPTYTFAVEYSDNVKVDASSLGDGNLLVTSPAGATLPARFESATPADGGALVRATYSIADPDGAFTAADSGQYTVRVASATAAAGVRDVNGLILPPAVVGTFVLNFPAPPTFPNLSLDAVTYAAGKYAPGGTIAIKTAVRNTGTAATSPFRLRIGLATEPTLSGGDAISLSTTEFPKGLQPGQSIPVKVPAAQLPDNAAGGAYYLRAIIEMDATPTQAAAVAAPPAGGPPASPPPRVAAGPDKPPSTFLAASPDVVIVPPPPPVVTPPIGGVDSSFGVNGFVRVRTGLRATNGVVLQADNKRLAIGPADGDGGGDFGVARFNVDGSLDTTFGGNGTGVAFTDVAGNNDEPVAIRVQADGKILVAGTATAPGTGGAESQFALVRYNADGTLDATFGVNGIALTDFAQGSGSSADVATDLAVLADGKLLVSGGTTAAGRGTDFAFARYTANGAADATFGNGTGRVLTDFAGGDDSANALSIDPRTGQMIAAGSAAVPGTGAGAGTTQFAVARYNADGSLDAGFGTAGVVMTPVGGADDEAFAVAVNARGQIVVAGAAFAGGSSDFAVARYTTKGVLDKSFNRTGVARTAFGKAAVANQVSLSDDGSLLVAGAVTDSLAALDASHLSIGLAVYLADGSLDPSFDDDGKTVLDLNAAGAPAPVGAPAVGGFSQAQQALAVLARQKAICVALGKVIIVGTSGDDTVASQVTTSGADLTTTLTPKLPPAIVGGAKGSALVSISDTGNRPAAGTATISLFLSLDGVVDAGDVPLATLAGRKVSLPPGGAKAFKTKFAVPRDVADGSYFVLAQLDTSDTITELTQGNNTARAASRVRVAAPFAQLAGNAPRPPAGLSAGGEGLTLLAVTNAGNITARGTFDCSFVAADSGTPGADDTTLATMQKVKVSLKPGETRLFLVTLKLPADLAPGTYYLLGVLESTFRTTGAGASETVVAGIRPLIVG